MDSYPDSAYFLLSGIIEPSELTDAEKADYGYLTALYHSEEGKAMAEDGIILFSLGYYKDHNVTEKLVTTYILAGQYYSWNDDLQMATTMWKGGLDLALEMKDSVMIPIICRGMAENYFSKKEYQNAITSFRQTLEYVSDHSSIYYMTGLS